MLQNNSIYELWKLSCFPISFQIKILFRRNIHAYTAYDHINFKENVIFNKSPKWPSYSLIIITIKQETTTAIPDLTSINLNATKNIEKHKDSHRKPTRKTRKRKIQKRRQRGQREIELKQQFWSIPTTRKHNNSRKNPTPEIKIRKKIK